jgi:hypothetical protein
MVAAIVFMGTNILNYQNAKGTLGRPDARADASKLLYAVKGERD